MVATHPIFNTPNPVTLHYEEIPTPASYRRYVEGADLPETIQIWKVHDKPETRNVGLVSDGYRFGDSPDCEFIASGQNTKNSSALALGRQGHWFLWGFCGDPVEMTPDARLVFLNTVAYMRGFAGHPVLVGKQSRARDWAPNYPGFYPKPEQRNLLARNFGEALMAIHDKDPEGFGPFLKRHIDHLYTVKTQVVTKRADGRESTSEVHQFHLDEDSLALDIKNNDPALLLHCIERLEKGSGDDQRARALRLLSRYAPTDVLERCGEDAAAWRQWFDGAEERIFFSDAGGYRFQVAPKSPTTALRILGAGEDDVLQLKATLDGDMLELTVAVRSGFHVYGPGAKDGEPIRIEAAAKSGYALVGPMQIEPAALELSDTFTVRQRVKRNGEGDLRFSFQYTACDPTLCFPPASLEVVR